jgi:hypothetical protein
MAHKGEFAKCSCGKLVAVRNERLDFHRRIVEQPCRGSGREVTGEGVTRVKCCCGKSIALEGGCIPAHTSLSDGPTCKRSGEHALLFSTVAPDPQAILRALLKNAVCPSPECGATGQIINIPEDHPHAAHYPLMCGACKTVGTVQSFLQAKLKSPSLPVRHRY